MSNTRLKRQEKRKVTFTVGENETEIDCADKERTPTVYTKCEGNPRVVSICISGSGCR